MVQHVYDIESQQWDKAVDDSKWYFELCCCFPVFMDWGLFSCCWLKLPYHAYKTNKDPCGCVPHKHVRLSATHKHTHSGPRAGTTLTHTQFARAHKSADTRNDAVHYPHSSTPGGVFNNKYQVSSLHLDIFCIAMKFEKQQLNCCKFMVNYNNIETISQNFIAI